MNDEAEGGAMTDKTEKTGMRSSTEAHAENRRQPRAGGPRDLLSR